MASRGLMLSLLLLASVSQLHAQSPCTTSIYDAVGASKGLETLKVVIEAAGLKDTLSNTALAVTVAAPNNDAFDALLKALNASGLTLADVTAPESNKAASILLYHVVPAVAFAKDLKDMEVLPTLLGAGYNLTVDLSSGVTFIAAKSIANVVTADVKVCDSVVHVVDAVLIPDELANIPNYMPPKMSAPEAAPPAQNTPYYPPTSSPPPPESQPGGVGEVSCSVAVGVLSAATAFMFAVS